VQSGSRSSTGELLTYFCYIFTLVSVVTFTICFFLQESIRKKWSKNMMKTSTMRWSPLTVGSSMIAEAKKHMDGEIDALFSLTLLMPRYGTSYYYLLLFLEGLLCSTGCWTLGRQCHRGEVRRPRLLVLHLVYLRYT
jgi:hypothetical protein